MRHNMGHIERFFRVLAGACLFLFAWLAYSTADIFWGGVRSQTITGIVLSIIGLVVFFTGSASYCPMNEIMHQNSCEACKLGETHSHMPV